MSRVSRSTEVQAARWDSTPYPENQREPKRTKGYQELNFAGRWLPGEAEMMQKQCRNHTQPQGPSLSY